MSDRGRFEHAVRVTHDGHSCATCTQFYTSGGVVHPIRGSPGYDPSVEGQAAEHAHRRAREAHYATARQERGAQVVERPPWAAGLADKHLLAIAKAHGQSAGGHLWWEKAGLYHGMAELRSELREGGHVGDTRGRVRVRQSVVKREAEQSRAEARRIATASATGAGVDLPF